MGISGLIDIKGPVPFQGLPPFALTTLILVAAAIIARFLRRRSDRPVCSDQPIAPNPESPDTLERLTSEYQYGLLGADELFCRLSALLAEGLPVSMGQVGGLTSTELLMLITSGNGNPETVQLSSELLMLCDQVKFAGYQPSDQEITGALVSARHLLTERFGGER